MDDILNYFIKKSDLQKSEYFKYKNKNAAKTNAGIAFTISDDIIADNYIVFDFETTGFSPKNNKIIEIGAVKINDNNIVDKFDTLINPNSFIPPFIEAKINITNQMVADKPVIEDVLPEFIEFLGDYPLVSHNAKFDMSFLTVNAENLGFKINNTAIDTLKLSRKAFPDLKSHSLGNLCNHFGINLISAHRAYYDALATYELYKIIYNKIRNSAL